MSIASVGIERLLSAGQIGSRSCRVCLNGYNTWRTPPVRAVALGQRFRYNSTITATNDKVIPKEEEAVPKSGKLAN